MEKHHFRFQLIIYSLIVSICGSVCQGLAASNQTASVAKQTDSKPAGGVESKAKDERPAMKFPLSSTDKQKDGRPTKAGELFIKGWTAYSYLLNNFAAKKFFKEGLAIDPGSASNNYGMWYASVGKDGEEACLKFLKAALKRDPKYKEALLEEAFMLRNNHYPDEAVKVFTEIIKLDPTNIDALAYRGDVYYDTDQIDLARKDLVTLHTMAPENPGTLMLKAQLQYYDAQYPWVRFNCNKILLTGANAQAYFYRSKANARLFDFFAARSDIKLSESKGWTGMEWWKEQIDDFEYDHLHAEKDPAKRWVLACSAPIFESNHQGFESLQGSKPTPERREDDRDKLANSWNIRDGKTLKAVVTKCLNGQMCNPSWIAMRKGYNENPKSFESSRKELSDELKLVKEYGDRLGERGILAYELGRAIANCRWAYSAGYITEDEAFQIMLPVAVRIQKLYRSWDDYVESYFIGKRFWNSAGYRKAPARVERVKHLLMVDQNGLKKIPWNTKLAYASSQSQQQHGFKWPWDNSN